MSDAYFTSTENYLNATRLFATKGYHSVTMDELAQCLGVAKGTLYYHYKNKEEIYFALIRRGLRIMEDCVNDAIANLQHPLERLSMAIMAQLNFITRYVDATNLFLRELFGNSDRRVCLRDLLYDYQNVIKNIIVEGQEKGVITKKVPADMLVTVIFGMVSTVALHYINAALDKPIELVHKEVTRVVFEGIAEDETWVTKSKYIQK
ncbi:MAG: TetR/AcrR family transcriptional regulator [Bacillota bacterium]